MIQLVSLIQTEKSIKASEERNPPSNSLGHPLGHSHKLKVKRGRKRRKTLILQAAYYG